MGSRSGKMRNTWAVMAILAIQLGCSSVVPNRQPVGKIFPSIEGTALSGETRYFPDTESETLTILLIGYTQFSQFDLDRWILGLTQLEVSAQVVEIPTIPGILPGLFANQIDSGMRRGIPETDWESVVTVYSDGGRLVAFLGNEKKDNGRVVLLDQAGVVRWFWDRGYSATAILDLSETVQALSPTPAVPSVAPRYENP